MIKNIIGAKRKTLALLLITNLRVLVVTLKNPTGQCTVYVKYSVTIFIGSKTKKYPIGLSCDINLLFQSL